jgi:hypothetical protein
VRSGRAAILLSAAILALVAAPPPTVAQPAPSSVRSVERITNALFPPDYLIALAFHIVDSSLGDAFQNDPQLKVFARDYPGLQQSTLDNVHAVLRQGVIERQPQLVAKIHDRLIEKLTPDQLETVAAFYATPAGRKSAIIGQRVEKNSGTADYDLIDPTKPPPDATATDLALLKAFEATTAAQAWAIQTPDLKQILVTWIGDTLTAEGPRMHEVMMSSVDGYRASHSRTDPPPPP